MAKAKKQFDYTFTDGKEVNGEFSMYAESLKQAKEMIHESLKENPPEGAKYEDLKVEVKAHKEGK